MGKKGKQTVKAVGKDLKFGSSAEVQAYFRGWNDALAVMINIMEDVLHVKKEDTEADGLGVS